MTKPNNQEIRPKIKDEKKIHPPVKPRSRENKDNGKSITMFMASNIQPIDISGLRRFLDAQAAPIINTNGTDNTAIKIRKPNTIPDNSLIFSIAHSPCNT
jgi:hypothetical protein